MGRFRKKKDIFFPCIYSIFSQLYLRLGPMQRRASELRQVWKEAAVTRILVCRRVPGRFLLG